MEDRMAVLAALESVSLVVEFDEDTALEVVQEARPDIYAKGGDYVMDQIPEGKAVLAYGGKAVAIDFEHDRSTTKLLTKVRSTG
jgi:rfaE bifunctional protein nucleotidyltransferase chain/domain